MKTTVPLSLWRTTRKIVWYIPRGHNCQPSAIFKWLFNFQKVVGDDFDKEIYKDIIISEWGYYV